jgi:hypothetical protein
MAEEEKDQEKSEEKVPVEDAFGDAFDEAVAADEGEEKAPIEEAEEPEEGAEETLEEEESEEEEPTSKDVKEEPVEEEAGDESDKEGSESEKDESGDDDEPEETLESVTQKYKTLQGMFNSEVRKTKDLEDKVALKDGGDDQKAEDKSGKKEEVKDEPAVDMPAILSEIAELDSFKNVKEEYGDDLTNLFNDIATKLITITNQATSGLSKEMTGKFGELSEVVNPLHSSHVKSEGNKHVNALVEAHSDAQEIVESGDLRKWIEEQPAYKKKMYTEVYEDGATADVIDLFSTYKKENGLTEAEEPEEEKSEEEKPEDATKQEKLEDMEDIDIKKTPVSTRSGGVDQNDFGAAFQ